jgi:hypothetical protein
MSLHRRQVPNTARDWTSPPTVGSPASRRSTPPISIFPRCGGFWVMRSATQSFQLPKSLSFKFQSEYRNLQSYYSSVLISGYRRSFTMASPSDRRPLVISGPSGVGKGTLINMLFSRHPDTFTLSVSHTTRNPRNGERDGVEYHFVTKDAFRELIDQDGFVEQ